MSNSKLEERMQLEAGYPVIIESWEEGERSSFLKNKKIKKSFDLITKAFNQDLLTVEQYLDAKDKFEKARTGVYADNAENRKLKRVGQKYGNKAQEENKDTSNKETKENKQDIQYTDLELKEHAKNASESDLKAQITQGTDPKLRQIAHEELNRRAKEEAVKSKEENDYVEKFRTLSDEQVKYYLDAPHEKIKQAAKMVADERGLKVISKKDYIEQFEDYTSEPRSVTRKFYEEESKKIKEYLDKNKELANSLNEYVDFDKNVFRDVRNFLTNPEYKGSDLSKEVENISKIINENKITKDLILNRRVLTGNTFFANLKEGDIYEDKSFSSTSLREIDIFGDFNIKILAKSGSRVSNIGNEHEFEYLIDKDSKFRVIEKAKDGLSITVELL